MNGQHDRIENRQRFCGLFFVHEALTGKVRIAKAWGLRLLTAPEESARWEAGGK